MIAWNASAEGGEGQIPMCRRVLAVIPSYRRPDQLDRCLAALAIQPQPPEVLVHENSVRNLGYTCAVNVGLRAAITRGAAYALALNQDCYARPGAVECLVSFMDAHPNCAIAGPKQLLARDEDWIVHGGCREAYPAGRHVVGRVSRGDCAVSRRMPWVNGACLIARTNAVFDIGLMDENYFLVMSDADWCYTARARGWEVWYCAEAECRHEVGITGSPPPPELAVAMARDAAFFRDKWLGSKLYTRLAVPEVP
jgi:GT2 family glycosyltransferase